MTCFDLSWIVKIFCRFYDSKWKKIPCQQKNDVSLLGVVTPTVKALELLEKLADERSRLIEDKLTADKLVESLRRSHESNETSADGENDNDGKLVMENFFEEKLKSKGGENLKLQKIIAENRIQEANQQAGYGVNYLNKLLNFLLAQICLRTQLATMRSVPELQIKLQTELQSN